MGTFPSCTLCTCMMSGPQRLQAQQFLSLPGLAWVSCAAQCEGPRGRLLCCHGHVGVVGPCGAIRQGRCCSSSPWGIGWTAHPQILRCLMESWFTGTGHRADRDREFRKQLPPGGCRGMEGVVVRAVDWNRAFRVDGHAG